MFQRHLLMPENLEKLADCCCCENYEIIKIDDIQKYFKEAYGRTRAFMQKLQPALKANKPVSRKQ